MKKVFAVILAITLVATCAFALAACQPTDEFKIGFICLHDTNSTYDANFINAAYEVQEALGLEDSQVIVKTGIEESEACYDAAADLVDQGCDIVFADSFGHEDYMIQAAQEFPEVEFCHATGTKAHTAGLDNYHNAFAAIYQGRFLAGVAAGLKLNEMIDNGDITEDEAHIGYVVAFTYAEVISGYTSFYLGVKYVCPTVTMDVQVTGSWYDEVAERTAALNLIQNQDCVLISQHADSMGAPSACEENNVPNVSYNGSTVAACPNTFIISSRINWAPYYTYIIECVQNGRAIDTDWCGTLSNGSVELSAVNTTAAAEGTQAYLDDVKADLIAGDLHVFDCSTFTVGGNTLTSYLADVDTDAEFTPDTQVITSCVLYESV